MPNQLALDRYPALLKVTGFLDDYLRRSFPDFFGPNATHPILPIKRSKVVHDNLWGTNRFTWRELLLVDCPIIQRLRDIHQVGLAFHVYPSAHHTRFEHCLGVVTIASRIFDAVLRRNRGELETIRKVIASGEDPQSYFPRLKQELRLAALLHDAGHSLFSHASERVYQELDMLKEASSELKRFTGKEKGAGEVISFCFANTASISQLLGRASLKLIGDTSSEDYTGDIDLANVALLIVGRARHPFLQFLGDIVSSGFDADKLDYLLRDARAAGLPLRYDLDRYLYAVRLEKGYIYDDESELQGLYNSTGALRAERLPVGPGRRYPYFETYRLRLPASAVNAIEQIIICKMMLFSYLYHHPKVRAAEGLLERSLGRTLTLWKVKGDPEEEILQRFLRMTDSALSGPFFLDSKDALVHEYSYRLLNRLLPREVYRLWGGAASHADRALLTDFLTDMQNKERRDQLIRKLEEAIGEELTKLNPELGETPSDALSTTGVWVDVPKAPTFEGVDELVIGGTEEVVGVTLMQLFPINQWTQAYTHYRYHVRVFSFSDYWDATNTAAQSAMQRVIGIQGNAFYERVRRVRE